MATSQASRPSPKQTKDSLNNKAGIGGTASGTGGTTALLSRGPTSQLSRPTPKQTLASLHNKVDPGKSTGASGSQMGPEGVAHPPSSAAPSVTTPSQPGPTYGPNGRPLSDGTIQTYDDPSAGQVLSALARLPTGPFGVVSTLASVADSDQYGRDLMGRAVDNETGSTPDPGYQGPNHISSSTNSRGDNDTRLLDRAALGAQDQLSAAAGAPSPNAPIGGDDGGAEFSTVRLSDRRRPYDAASAVDLLRGLL